MTASSLRPKVAIVCDAKVIDGHVFQAVYEKYVTAIAQGSDALPLLFPVLPQPLDPREILHGVEGVLMTGSRSNVHPDRYQGPPPRPEVQLDQQRDGTSLALIRAAVEMGRPLLCICRGFQELNVAYGGSLHQHLSEIPGRMCHHENDEDPLDVQYGPAHSVTLREGGVLHGIVGEKEFSVNSLHQQGIDRLADGLTIEAMAPDSTIEAVSVTAADRFALGVQWHPEWKFADNEQSRRLFRAFGAALRGG